MKRQIVSILLGLALLGLVIVFFAQSSTDYVDVDAIVSKSGSSIVAEMLEDGYFDSYDGSSNDLERFVRVVDAVESACGWYGGFSYSPTPRLLVGVKCAGELTAIQPATFGGFEVSVWNDGGQGKEEVTIVSSRLEFTLAYSPAQTTE